MEKQPSGKIGVGITTYNSENYFEELYNSIPFDKIDELVVVNGGKEYNKKYNADWIQHKKNRFPSTCRNDCVTFLLNKNCEHVFLIEDDMIIKNENIFNSYIDASKISGLKYFSFASMSVNAGPPNQRTPKLTVGYNPKVSISFYENMCNEFTYHHKTCFLQTGLYDSNMRDLFDADRVYRETLHNKNVAPFWWFADLANADDYIMNNPNATSRLQDTNRPDGSRNDFIHDTLKYFEDKHGIPINNIPLKTKEELINFLKQIKHENCYRN
jgi:glycosyltransferase involved in cell wall biosynthesis